MKAHYNLIADFEENTNILFEIMTSSNLNFPVRSSKVTLCRKERSLKETLYEDRDRESLRNPILTKCFF